MTLDEWLDENKRLIHNYLNSTIDSGRGSRSRSRSMFPGGKIYSEQKNIDMETLIKVAQKLLEYHKSIATNSCCSSCQEAKLWSIEAITSAEKLINE